MRGLGHIEFSTRGIPHGSLHFPEQVKWAGHMYMFDTCAPEAAHKFNIKQPMDRVRKLDDSVTEASMIHWTLQTRTWTKIVTVVQSEFLPAKEKAKRKPPDCLTVVVSNKMMHLPTNDVRHLFSHGTFSPLERGGDNLLSPDVRVSYYELGRLISSLKSWSIVHVTKRLQVRLYCCARVLHPNGDTRTFWSTDPLNM